tara:strand:+ start:1813 stop:2037 length:225 start_codon:yes stop_codon:yes gene_type:complete
MNLKNILELTYKAIAKNSYIYAKENSDIMHTPSHNQISKSLNNKSLGRWKTYKKYFEGLELVLNAWISKFNYRS